MKCRDLYRFTRIAQTALAPCGDRLAYVTRRASSSENRFITGLFLEGRSVGAGLRDPVWSPDGRRIAAVQPQPGGTTKICVYSVSDAGDLRQLVSTPLGRASALAWAPSGRSLAFLMVTPAELSDSHATGALGRRVDGLPPDRGWNQHLYVLDIATAAVRRVSEGEVWVDSFCFGRDDVSLAYAAAADHGVIPRQPGAVRPSILWRVDLREGAQAAITDPTWAARNPLLTPDGCEAIFVGLGELAAEPPALYCIQLDGRSRRRLAPRFDRSVLVNNANLQGGSPPVIGPDGAVYFCARDDGSSRLFRLRPAMGDEITRLAGSEDESIAAVSISAEGSTLAYVVTTPDGGQRLDTMDLVGGGPARTHVRIGPPDTAIIAREWRFAARDGVALQGWLIRQPDATAGPLLIDVHGGSFSGAWAPQLDPSRLYQQELAATGWTVLLLNARGSDGYGRQFARAAIGQWGSADASDFLDAIHALAERGTIDPRRVAVTGYSYGGFMCHWLTATSDRFRASVAGGSICDFVSLFDSSDMGWSMCRYDIGVDPVSNEHDAVARSPLAQVHKVRTPTLLLHGDADQRCPLSQAEEWLAGLQSRGVTSELVSYSGASHGFLTEGPPTYIVDYGERLVRWVCTHTAGNDAAATPGAHE